MLLFEKFYVLFNQIECLIWWAFGAYFVFLLFRDQHRPRLRLAECCLVICFFFFGLSDYVESNDQGGLPWWLWLWKISLGSVLFGLLIWRDYVQRGSAALKPWRFIAASLILSLALYQAL